MKKEVTINIEGIWMRATRPPQRHRQNNRSMAKERLAPPHIHLRSNAPRTRNPTLPAIWKRPM